MEHSSAKKPKEITWEIVDNTVESRMIDSSLIHKLVPNRKLRRRTKAMNAQIRRVHGIKNYKQYVVIKTSVLRNLSDDSDTEEDEVLIDDDYSTMHKHNISLKDYMKCRKRASLSHKEINIPILKTSIPNAAPKKVNTRNSKRKSSQSIGWRDVIRKKRDENVSLSSDISQMHNFALDSLFFFRNSNIHKDTEDDLSVSNSQRRTRSSSKRNSLSQRTDILKNDEACISKEVLESHDETTGLHEIIHNVIAREEIRYASKIAESPNNKMKHKNESPTNSTENPIEESQLDESYVLSKTAESPNNNMKHKNKSATNSIENHIEKSQLDESYVLSKTAESPNNKMKHKNESPTNSTENPIEESQLDESYVLSKTAGSPNNKMKHKNKSPTNSTENPIEQSQLDESYVLSKTAGSPNNKMKHKNKSATNSIENHIEKSQLDESYVLSKTAESPNNKMKHKNESPTNSTENPIEQSQLDESYVLSKTTENPNNNMKHKNKSATNSIENHIEESQLDEKYSQKMFGSQNTRKRVKRNLMSILNDESTIQDFKEPSVSAEAYVDEEAHTNCLSKSSTTKRASMNGDKSKTFPEMQYSFNGNTNQPKDSGIDEDTEEEFPEDTKKICNKAKGKVEETPENLQSTSSTSKHDDNFAIETYLSSIDNDKNGDVSNDALDKMDTENEMSSPLKSEDSRKKDRKGDQQDRTVRQKSQPRVTCTEIVNKKYRIVPYNASSSNDCTILETSATHFSDHEALENVKADQDMEEDSMSALSKKRLQQLRRLNLTADSESSLSEDDDKCTVENMRSKLLKRSTESSDISNNEYENANSGPAISVEFSKKKKKKKHKKLKIGKYGKEQLSDSIITHEENKKTSDSDNSLDHVLKSLSQKDQNKNTSRNSSGRTISCLDSKNNSKSFSDRNLDPCKSNHLNDAVNHNFNQNKDKGSDENDLETGTMTEIMNEKSRIRRPSNLQGFMKENDLIYDTTMPSFRFKDIEDEDDVFILDIPAMVLEHELVGKRIVLTEKKLRLGKQKYKVTFKDADHVSCVFGTGQSDKPCKTVNIKPIAKIVACQKNS